MFAGGGGAAAAVGLVFAVCSLVVVCHFIRSVRRVDAFETVTVCRRVVCVSVSVAFVRLNSVRMERRCSLSL